MYIILRREDQFRPDDLWECFDSFWPTIGVLQNSGHNTDTVRNDNDKTSTLFFKCGTRPVSHCEYWSPMVPRILHGKWIKRDNITIQRHEVIRVTHCRRDSPQLWQ